MYSRNFRKGFTLIELLVVIAIIGVLASVTLSQINDARALAKNTTTNQLASEYAKALLQFSINNNNLYPGMSGENQLCLGDYDDDLCGSNNGTIEVASFNNKLINTMPQLPTVEVVENTGPGGNEFFEGLTYACFNSEDMDQNVGCRDFTIFYYLPGTNQKCAGGYLGSTDGEGTSCIAFIR